MVTTLFLLTTVRQGVSASGVQLEYDVSIRVDLTTYWDESTIGVRDGASSGFDVNWDIIDTPPPPRGIISYVWHPDNPSSPVDFRRLSISRISTANATWEYHVIPVEVSGEATISWNVSAFSPSTSVKLLDEEGETLANMFETPYYTVYIEAGASYRFFITVSIEESISEPEPEPEPEPETESDQRGIPGFPFVSVILGLLIAQIIHIRNQS